MNSPIMNRSAIKPMLSNRPRGVPGVNDSGRSWIALAAMFDKGPTDHTRCDDGIVPVICPTCQSVS
jgi:hypothetical protein